MNGSTPGALMSAEMAEQPRVLTGLIGRSRRIREVVAGIMPEPLAGIALLARGSSDHAATFGRYALEAATGRPVSEVAPSLHALYEVQADYRGWLLIAVSQSGATPEIVTVSERLRAAGAATLAVTNDPASPLAEATHAVIDLDAGPERAVPATKTVTATMLSFALIAGAMPHPLVSATDLGVLPQKVAATLAEAEPPEAAARRLVDASGLVVIARGFLYAAALESALKLRETSGLAAVAYSAADLRHGPIAAIHPGALALTFRVGGPAGSDVASLEAELSRRGVGLVQVSPEAGAPIPLTGQLPEPLAVIPAVVRGQQLSRAGALQIGIDPDEPFGLRKVTRT